jgi:hypothetical protein
MAKRSRRERRLDVEKQKQFTPKAAPAGAPASEVEPSTMPTEEFTPAPAKVLQPAPVSSRKTATINFAHEYYYVYHELITVLIITAIMFAVMAGLSFTI